MTARSVRIVCPECRAEVQVNQRALGRKMRCPHCNAVFTASEEQANQTDGDKPAARTDDVAPPPVVAAPPLVAAPTQARWTIAGDAPPPLVRPQPAAVLDEATPGVKKRAKRGFSEAEMDMTPMVDVTFQLLIFFMLTAAFTITKSQQFPRPEQTEESTTPKPPEEDPDFIIVRIDADNTYFVSGGDLGDEQEAPSPQELLMELKNARDGSVGSVATKLLVKAHGDCSHERVVTAIDAGNDVGIEEVRVQTIEDEE